MGRGGLCVFAAAPRARPRAEPGALPVGAGSLDRGVFIMVMIVAILVYTIVPINPLIDVIAALRGRRDVTGDDNPGSGVFTGGIGDVSTQRMPSHLVYIKLR